MLYSISRLLLKIFLKIFFRLKIIGSDNLPVKGPYIAACNHVSYLDPPILGSGIPVPTRFLAQENLFRKGVFGWWMRSVGCIPVRRTTRDTKAIRKALSLLGKGYVIAVFPEGTRSIDGSIKNARAGMGFLACKANVPIVPAYIKGSKYALPKHSKSIKLKPIYIYFGRSIKPDCFKDSSDPKSTYKKISQEVMDEILRLKEEHGE